MAKAKPKTLVKVDAVDGTVALVVAHENTASYSRVVLPYAKKQFVHNYAHLLPGAHQADKIVMSMFPVDSIDGYEGLEYYRGIIGETEFPPSLTIVTFEIS